jgi:hypothetical protein
LLQELAPVQHSINEIVERYQSELTLIHPEFKKSAQNLLQYMALRHFDVG